MQGSHGHQPAADPDSHHCPKEPVRAIVQPLCNIWVVVEILHHRNDVSSGTTHTVSSRRAEHAPYPHSNLVMQALKVLNWVSWVGDKSHCEKPHSLTSIYRVMPRYSVIPTATETRHRKRTKTTLYGQGVAITMAILH